MLMNYHIRSSQFYTFSESVMMAMQLSILWKWGVKVFGNSED